MEKKRGQYEQEIARLRQQISVERGEKEKITGMAEQASIEMDRIQQAHADLKNELSQMRERLNKAEVREGILQAKYDQISQQNEGNIHALEVKSKAVIEIEQTAAMADAKIVDLAKRLSQSQDKVEALRQDYLFAVQEKANVEGQLKQLQGIGKKGTLPL